MTSFDLMLLDENPAVWTEESLRGRLGEADRHYAATGEPGLPEGIYAWLADTYERLTGKPWVMKTPVRVASGGKVPHTRPMLSIQKAYSIDKVVEWARRYAPGRTLAVMPKYDGVALAKYPGGTVGTRGDGEVGEDVTAAAGGFMADERPGYGEAVIPLDAFERQFADVYKYPRSAISGILNADDPEITARSRYAEFVRYDHIEEEVDFISEPREFAARLEEAAERVTALAANYPLDGVVFRIADGAAFESCGRTAHHWRGQIALKFKNLETSSIIEGIRWQESNGTLTPVAELAPVRLGGKEISSGSLYNADRVINWDVRVGDGVTVELAGGVNVFLSKTWRTENSAAAPTAVPRHCPSCGLSLLRQGARRYCARCDK